MTMSDFEQDFLNRMHDQSQPSNYPSNTSAYDGEKRKAIIFTVIAVVVMIALGCVIVAKRIVTELQQKDNEVTTILSCGQEDAIQYVFRDDGKFYSTSLYLDSKDIEHSTAVIGDYSMENNKIKTTTTSSSRDGGAYVEITPYSNDLELTEIENQKYLKVGTDSIKCTEATNETSEE